MYATYCYAAGSTQANVSADIIKLLTGETNKANLSANCVQASTEIISTVAAGWTVHDAAAATNFQVITALCQDGTTPKYYRFGLPSTTATEGTISEGWNAATHTATNGHTQGVAAVQGSWNATSGGFFYIYATQKNIMMFSYHTSAYQNSRGLQVIEHDGVTTQGGYPKFASLYGSGSGSDGGFYPATAGAAPFAHTRVKRADAAGDLLSTASTSFGNASLGVQGAVYPSSAISALYRDASEVTQAIIYRVGIGLYHPQYSPQTGSRYYGEVYDLRCAFSQLGASRDEITVGGKTYVLHGATGNGYHYLIPKE